MKQKSRNIIQCPFCNSNRLYFRRGLVADILISLLTPVRSYTCGSCSRSFRKYGNYFTSKQALIHIFSLLAIVAFINPSILLPENWLLKEQKIESVGQSPAEYGTAHFKDDDIPFLSTAIINATNSSQAFMNGTVADSTASNSTTIVLTNASSANATANASSALETNSTSSGQLNSTARTILSFNASEISNATAKSDKKAKPTKEAAKRGLQEGKLSSIYFKDVRGKTRIELDLGGSPLSYTSFFLSDPDRLVVDIHGKWEYYGPTTLRPENPIFSKFRIGIYEDKIRMVMDLKGKTPAPVITKTMHGLNIDVK